MSRTVIVGGGIIGLCCAYELRALGEEVVVLDQGEPGAGASSGNAGLLVPSFSGPIPGPGGFWAVLRSMLRPAEPFYANPRALSETAGWLLRYWRHCNARDHESGLEAIARLAAESMALFDRLAAGGVRFEMHRDGVLFVALDERRLESHLAGLDRMTPYGYARPALLTGAELREMEPWLSDRVRAGFLLPQERHVQPETLIAGLRARLAEMGAEVRAHVAATGFRVHGRRVEAVVTASRILDADRVLIAAGAWSGRLARMCGVEIPLTGVRGYSLTAQAPPQRIRRPLYLGESLLIVSPFQTSMRLAGWLEFSGIDPGVDDRRIAAMRRAAAPYLSELDFAAFQQRRAGLRPLAPDGLPVIGPLSDYDNLFVATGHGVLGITLAPPTARLLASMMVNGKVEAGAQPFLPSRFH